LFTPGDTFYLFVNLCNPSSGTYQEQPVFVLLDVFGSYYFGPDWAEVVDYWLVDVVPGTQTIRAIEPFEWPAGVGATSGILIYAAMTNAEITELFGAYDLVSFGWQE